MLLALVRKCIVCLERINTTYAKARGGNAAYVWVFRLGEVVKKVFRDEDSGKDTLGLFR